MAGDLAAALRGLDGVEDAQVIIAATVHPLLLPVNVSAPLPAPLVSAYVRRMPKKLLVFVRKGE